MGYIYYFRYNGILFKDFLNKGVTRFDFLFRKDYVNFLWRLDCREVREEVMRFFKKLSFSLGKKR